MQRKNILTAIIFLAVFGLGVFAFSAEAQAVTTTKCADGIDNDGDGKIDFSNGSNNDPDCISAFDQSENSGHPFMIITKDMYSELRARENQTPWKEMKAEAISNCLSQSYPTTGNTRTKSETIQKMMNGCALAYILDLDSLNSQKQVYADKFKSNMAYWDSLSLEISGNAWDTSVPPGQAFVMSVIALDIFYDAIPDKVSLFEGKLGNVWNQFGWPHNSYGTKAVWWIYKKDNSKAREYANAYINELYGPSVATGGSGHISPDGAYASGVSYAMARLGATYDRGSGKAHSMDVMAFTGIHDFYNDVTIGNFYEWLFNFGANPFKAAPIFGDTNPGGPPTSPATVYSRSFYLDKFSEYAAKLAAWKLSIAGIPPAHNSIFVYALMDHRLPDPLKPKSRIFPDGGATFWEDNPSDKSLMGTILSSTYTEWHSHQEANSIYLSGFGEHLVMNSGYFGASSSYRCTPSTGGSFTRSSYTVANGASIVQIDNKGHNYYGYTANNGEGITEGFTNVFLDYASADSGSAVIGGHHQRNFIFIHPEGEKNNGYFVLVDEVKTTTAGAKANVLIRPNTHSINTIADKLKYEAPITGGSKAMMDIGGSISYSVEGAFRYDKSNTIVLDVFLGTEPMNVSFKNGMFAGFAYCVGGKYIQSDYTTDVNGKKNIVTVLFPGDNTHARSPMSRITGVNFSGAEISHSTSIKDYAIESSSSNPVIYNGVTFTGLAALYRTNNNENEFYFVRQGKEFNDGKTTKKGFSSNNPVSIYLQNKIGKIIVPAGGATVAFFYPGITGIKIDGVAQQNNINISEGNHEVEILTGSILNPSDINSDTHVNIKDIQACIKVITNSQTDTNIIAKCNALAEPIGNTNIKDIQVIIRAIIGG